MGVHSAIVRGGCVRPIWTSPVEYVSSGRNVSLSQRRSGAVQWAEEMKESE